MSALQLFELKAALSHSKRRRAHRRLAALATVLVLLLSAMTLTLMLRDQLQGQLDPPPRAASPSAAAESRVPTSSSPAATIAVQWMEENAAPGARLLVPARIAGQLDAALPLLEVVDYDSLGKDQDVDLIVLGTSGDPVSPVGSRAQRIAASANVVARLTAANLEVREVRRPDSIGSDRRAVGQELLANPALSFSQRAAADLRRGRVDERILVILAGLASQHALELDLPVVPMTAPAAARRTLHITGIDGRPVAETEKAQQVINFVKAQQGGLAGPDVDVVPGSGAPALSIRYLLPSPIGVIDGGSFPTTSEEPS